MGMASSRCVELVIVMVGEILTCTERERERERGERVKIERRKYRDV